jgi:hypothetical protein
MFTIVKNNLRALTHLRDGLPPPSSSPTSQEREIDSASYRRESNHFHLYSDLILIYPDCTLKIMSGWQAYVDTQLVASGHIKDACMLGAADGSVWGLTGDFQPRYYEADTEDDQGNPVKITVNEVEDLLACFQSYFASAPPNGLRINGVKYMWLGKGEEKGVGFVRAQKGSISLVMAASNTCIVIATADKNAGQVFTSAVTAVVNLTDYLNQSGY